jgi:phosphate starvation-inducible PhoH-like protein
LNRLLGEYDGHLALLEERLGIEAQAHGNVVTLTVPPRLRDSATC